MENFSAIDLSPLLVSLKTASLSIAVTFVLGLLAARAVTGIADGKVKAVADGLLTLPLVLPPTVAGFLLLSVFGLRGPVGKFLLDVLGYKIVFSWPATVLAAFFLSFPLMYRSCRGAFEQMDKNLIYAARTLGMSEWTIFRKVTTPVCLPGIVSGSALAFARGLGEFGATAMLAGNIAGKTRTLPLAVYSAVAAGDMKTAGFYVTVILLVCFLTLLLIGGRGRGGAS